MSEMRGVDKLWIIGQYGKMFRNNMVNVHASASLKRTSGRNG
jgi:hypothetical protein